MEERIEKRIRYALAVCGMSQRDVAKKMGASQSKVSRNINNIGDMSVGDFLKLLRILGLNIKLKGR